MPDRVTSGRAGVASVTNQTTPEKKDVANPGAVTASTAQDQMLPGELASTIAAVKGAKWALEPPKNAVQLRNSALVPAVPRSVVTKAWIRERITTLERFANDSSLPKEQRARADLAAALAQGMIVEHFAILFGKLEPGRLAIQDLQKALTLDPNSEEAAIAYAQTLMGIRNSGHRESAEKYLEVATTPELTRVIDRLATHPDSLVAQTLIGIASDSLAGDGPLPASVVAAKVGLDERLAKLRQDPRAVEEAEEQLRKLKSRGDGG